ncbi:TPA: hypothetical protein QC128_004436 [Bacillus cereus]|nr:hypothetical protein [Bacillus cereus]HDR8266700.1 hypothetical protein [Bacillus cereus]HDR8271767.1 hypothetical protein [Bacillus cereus]HDR8282988.1 hypothetical protein [Bacillus cereus]
MEIKDMFLITAAATTIMLSIVSILIIFINQNKRLRYDHEKNVVKLDDMRNYYESKLYEINKKLSADPIRWKETNHLILSGNENTLNTENIQKGIVSPSNFLLSHGLTKNDLEVDKLSVFVLTSFMDSERPLYSEIKNICSNVGLNCSRSDDDYISGDILPHILKKIAKARLIIVNLDGRNPNVYYELGIAHALDKPTILISKSINNAPFDLQSKNIIIYKDFTELNNKLSMELARTILNS